MKIDNAYRELKKTTNIKFSKLFEKIPKDVKLNKGKIGQMLEIYLGLSLTSKGIDFEDGELKSTKYGKVKKESSFAITMFRGWIDEMIKDNSLEFKETKLHKKTEKFILMVVNKDSENPDEWFFKKCFYFDCREGTILYNQLKKDYESIIKQIKVELKKSNGLIHTTNGKIIQIRTKGSGGSADKPIYSKLLNRNVSKKGMAFYFKNNKFFEFLKNNKLY